MVTDKNNILTERQKSRKKLYILFTVLIVVVVSSGLLEGLVRLRQYIVYGTAGDFRKVLVVDRKIHLRTLRPNTKIGTISINSLGFRGPEIVQPKPKKTLRLAFIGASTTYCAEVSSEQMAWPHIVAQQLATAMPGVRFDYINAGVPGYTVRSSRRNLTYRIRPLEPDAIVIYQATNDLTANVRRAAARAGFSASPPDKRSWLARHSLFWYLIEKNLLIIFSQNRALDADTKNFVLNPKTVSEKFERDLTALVREAQKTARFVAIATFAAQVRRGLSPERLRKAIVTASYYMPNVTAESIIAGYEEYNRVIRRVAKATGALLIEVAGKIPADDEHYIDSVHFRDAGSEAMAALVSKALEEDSGFQGMAAKIAGTAKN